MESEVRYKFPGKGKLSGFPRLTNPETYFSCFVLGSSCARMPILCLVSTVEALNSRRDSKILKSHTWEFELPTHLQRVLNQWKPCFKL